MKNPQQPPPPPPSRVYGKSAGLLFSLHIFLFEQVDIYIGCCFGVWGNGRNLPVQVCIIHSLASFLAPLPSSRKTLGRIRREERRGWRENHIRVNQQRNETILSAIPRLQNLSIFLIWDEVYVSLNTSNKDHAAMIVLLTEELKSGYILPQYVIWMICTTVYALNRKLNICNKCPWCMKGQEILETCVNTWWCWRESSSSVVPLHMTRPSTQFGKHAKYG